MRRLTCLDRDRELGPPAPRGSVRSETTEERLARLLDQAAELPADDPRAARYFDFFDRLCDRG